VQRSSQKRDDIGNAGDGSVLEALRRERDAAVAARDEAFDMLVNFTHEMRTPLTGMYGMANLLLGTELGEDQEHYARTIFNTGSHLRRLLDDVIELSILESDGFRLEPAPACLSQVVQDATDIVTPEARRKRISLSWQIDCELEDDFLVDAARLRQVLLNLAANAIRYTDKGSVRIVAGVESDPAGDRCLHLVVADTGLGMSAETVTGLFDRFMRAGPADRRGAGLGLAISRQIVELMGGRIQVESTPGEGSRFTVTMPLPPTAMTAQTNDGESVDAAPESAGSLDLLLVEDNDLNQIYFSTLLRAGGHLVTVAANGREGLAEARRKLYDAVLMDVQMPIMDGIAATRAIRALPDDWGKVPVIALSGGVDRRHKGLHEGVGFTAFLPKPVDTGELARTLSSATGKAVFIPDFAVPAPDALPPSSGAEEAVAAFLEKTAEQGRTRK